jgi:peptide/nickel transport system permease protein
MRAYLLRRLALAAITLFGITVVAFALVHLIPGSPVQTDLDSGSSVPVPPEYVEATRHLYGLDRPLPVQYVAWLRRVATLDFGESLRDHQPVATKIWSAAQVTIPIQLVVFALVFLIGVPIGVACAARHRRAMDRVASATLLGLYSLPTFWVAYMLVLACVRLWHIPVLGTETFGVEFPNPFSAMVDATWHVFLPAVVLALGGIAVDSRYMRASMVEAMNEDYIRTARAKGLSETQVAYRHALRNSLRPIVTFIGYLLPAFLGGSVIVEQIFGYPGMGRLMYEAMMERDMPVIMVELMIGSALVLLGNLLADVLYAVVDPRVRLD